MIRMCPECAHHRRRPALRVIASGSGASPGRVNAATEELKIERERRESEQRRIDEEYRFDYEPAFVPWCARYTPTPDELARLRAGLATAASIDDLVAGLDLGDRDFIIDPANGAVKPVFALCRRRNPSGDCVGFTPRAPAGKSP